MELKTIEDMAKQISNLRCASCVGISEILTPESKLIQFDLVDLYQNWNKFLGDKELSYSRFLNIYHNDLLLTYALREAILSLNKLDIEREKYHKSQDDRRMNILIKSNEATYHLVSLTVLLRINYERFLLCLQELFQYNTWCEFEKSRKSIIVKMKDENINQSLIDLVESIDINKIKEYRDKIIHRSGLYFQDFFPSISGRNNLDFDEFLLEIRNEITKFYVLMYRFVFYSIGRKPEFNLQYGSITLEELKKRLKETTSKSINSESDGRYTKSIFDIKRLSEQP